MKFLLDQDVYALTKTYLIESGHDVLSAAEIGLSRADDEVLLREAQHQKRILITNYSFSHSLIHTSRSFLFAVLDQRSISPDIHAWES